MKRLTINSSWFCNVKGDVLSAITVALALIPEAISFAIICGVDPMVGLYASFCIAVTVAIFGGRPAMISAATGAMALVMVTLVKDHGIEYMFAATILTGVIQFVLGKLKFGRFIEFVPHSVVLGFVNSLAILIFMAQLPHFKGESWMMYAMVAGTLAIIYILPRFTKAVPSALVAIIVMTIAAITLGINVRTVGDMGNILRSLPIFHLPQIPLSLNTLQIILPYSVTLALVGIMESLLTATILDEMTDSKSDKSKEVEGQGLGNIVAGFFGGMAGCAMIGQSVINVKSGGRGRLSTFLAGVLMLFFIICLGDVVQKIPMAALVGVMIMVCISTFEWKSIIDINKMPVSCYIVMLATMAVVVYTHNLAQGVIIGIALSAVIFAWKIAAVKIKEHSVEFDNKTYKVYKVYGQVFFASTTKFIDMFNYDADPQDVIIDFKNAHIWDHSAVNCISKIKEKYEKLNKQVSVVGLNNNSHQVVSRVNEAILS